jgi:hypothetical protein
MNLMKYEEKYRKLDDMLEESGGVITKEIEEYMEKVNAITIAKVFDLASIRDELEGYAKICKEEADRLTKKAKQLTQRAAWWKDRIIDVMTASGQKTLTNGVYKVTLTQNPLKIQIDDEEEIPASYKTVELKLSYDEYKKIKDIIEPKSVNMIPDKIKIKELYKSDMIEVAGVKYVKENNVRIS